MTEPSQILQFPFRSGLAEGTDPKTAPPGTLTRDENIVWKKSNLIEKRFGTEAKPATRVEDGAGSVTSAKRLITRGDELCILNDDGLFAFVGASSKWKKIRGRPPVASMTWETSLDPSFGVAASDCVTSAAGITVQAWISGDPTTGTGQGALFVQAFDATTRSILLPPVNITPTFNTCFGVRVLLLDANTVGVITRTEAVAPFSYRIRTIDLTTLVVSASTTLRNDGALTAPATYSGWDANLINGGFAIVYNCAVFGTFIASFDINLAAIAVGNVAAGEFSEVCALAGTNAVLYVAYSHAVATPRPVKIAIFDPVTLLQVGATTTVETSAAGSAARSLSLLEYDANNCVISYTMYEGNNTVRATTWKVSSANPPVVDATTQRGTWGTVATSRPFLLGGRCYHTLVEIGATGAPVTTFAGLNSALAEIEFTDASAVSGAAVFVSHRLVGKIEELTGGAVSSGIPRCEPNILSTTKAILPHPFLAAAAQKVSNWKCGSRILTVTVGASRALDFGRSITFGHEAYVAAGGLLAYDGGLTFDYGFFSSPKIGSLTTAGAGGLILAGTYLYSVLQEYRSLAGVMHRSPAASGATITTVGATSLNTIGVTATSLDLKEDLDTSFTNLTCANPPTLPLYRTILGGTVYQRLTYEPSFNTYDTDPRVDFEFITDGRGDASIDGAGTTLASRPALYTAQVLQDGQPPAPVTMFYFADRLWTLDGSELVWWYSKKFQDDIGIAPGFNPAFRYLFPERQIAGASMDEKCIFFSAKKIWFLQGQGPAPDGTASDFQGPFLIQSDGGCTNPRSVVSCPDGIMYEGSGDLFLLNRGLEVVWIGKPVQDKLRDFPVITSAVLLTKRNEIRFSCNATNGETGIVLVYNYSEKQWSTFKYSAGSSSSTAIADAVLWQGLYTFVTAAGLVFQEDEDTCLDSGTVWVTMDVETAEIFGEGPLSYQRVRRVYLKGGLSTQCDVTLRVATNGRAAYDGTPRHFPSATMAALGNAKIGQHVKVQKSDSIRVRITDAAPSSAGHVLGIGRGINLSAIGFEIAPKQGLDKRPERAKK